MIPKLVAVLMTDVSGYTAYTADAPRDELAGAIRQQQQITTPIVEQRRGRIVKWIGDAILAVFESATDAVLCGSEIQREFGIRGTRGGTAPPVTIKAVVTVGDVIVDHDGDIYGEAVNMAARIEKVAAPGEVYFTEAVRMATNRAEIPHERVGSFDLKGISGDVVVYRTAFGAPAAIVERAALVYADIAGVLGIANAHGWDVVHPMIDDAVSEAAGLARARGGTLRAVWGDACFLTFANALAAREAVIEWSATIARRAAAHDITMGLRFAMHVGTLRVMRHTIMGADVHVAETLCEVVEPGSMLVTAEAHAELVSAGIELEPYVPQAGGLSRWARRYPERAIWRMTI